jgi:ubiquinone/menaquinone biosynthesis C-methylase UbiE
VKHELRLDRLHLGMYGLALLRGWPFGDPDEATALVERIRALSADPAAEPMSAVIELDDPGMAGAYAAWSERYDTMPNGLVDTEQPVMESIVSSLAPGNTLDAGCGTGRLTALLTEAGHRVMGIDPSAQMLAIAAKKVAGATFALGDLRAIPLRDGSVDLAVCGLSLTHLHDLGPPIAELARVVRAGGHVVLSDIHPVAVATGGQAFFTTEEGRRVVARNAVHWPSSYVRAFAAAGLEIERMEEPLVGQAFVDDIPDDAVRTAARVALLDLPLLLIWVLRKGSSGAAARR